VAVDAESLEVGQDVPLEGILRGFAGQDDWDATDEKAKSRVVNGHRGGAASAGHEFETFRLTPDRPDLTASSPTARITDI
jgi:hypothetical protein